MEQFTRFDDALVIIKTTMWPELWIGREICWNKLNAFNSSKKIKSILIIQIVNQNTEILNWSKNSNSVKIVDVYDEAGQETHWV